MKAKLRECRLGTVWRQPSGLSLDTSKTYTLVGFMYDSRNSPALCRENETGKEDFFVACVEKEIVSGGLLPSMTKEQRLQEAEMERAMMLGAE